MIDAILEVLEYAGLGFSRYCMDGQNNQDKVMWGEMTEIGACGKRQARKACMGLGNRERCTGSHTTK
jgi:hypothetical protein